MNASPHFLLQVTACALLGLLLWAACAGVGLQILPRPNARADNEPWSGRRPGVAACVGLAALLFIGGIALVLRIPWWAYVVPFLVVGWWWATRLLLGGRPYRALPRSLVVTGAMAVAALLLVALLESIVGLRFPLNACDDLRAYLPMAHRLLDTYDLKEPWSVRRAESLGGFDLLRALPVAVFADAGAGVAETTIAGIFLAGLCIGSGLRSPPARLLRVALIVAIPFLWVPRINTTGVLFAVPLLVAVIAATGAVRRELAAQAQRSAFRWAAAGGMVIAALMSVRPSVGLFGAFILAVGSLSNSHVRFGERCKLLLVGGATTFIAVAPWSFAMWRTVGTPLYPLFSGNLNTTAAATPPIGSLWLRVRLALDVTSAGPYIWVALGVVATALVARRLLTDVPLIVTSAAAAVLASFVVAFSTSSLLAAPTVYARYVAPMTEAVVVFLVCETLHTADANAYRGPTRRVGRLIPVAISASIALAALSFSPSGIASSSLLPSGAHLVELAAAHPSLAGDIDGQRDFYRQALASLKGHRTIAAVDRPYLIDYRKYDIFNLDAPGFMTPTGSFPFFTGPRRKLLVFQRAGYDTLLVTDPNSDICIAPSWERLMLAVSPRSSSGVRTRYLDWDTDIQTIEQEAPAAVRRFGPLLRIDIDRALAILAK